MFQPADALTMENAALALQAGLRAIDGGQTEIDLAQLTTVDSAAVATLVAWQRAAGMRGSVVRFRNIPANLARLIRLYGVAGLLSTDRHDLSHH